MVSISKKHPKINQTSIRNESTGNRRKNAHDLRRASLQDHLLSGSHSILLPYRLDVWAPFDKPVLLICASSGLLTNWNLASQGRRERRSVPSVNLIPQILCPLLFDGNNVLVVRGMVSCAGACWRGT